MDRQARRMMWSTGSRKRQSFTFIELLLSVSILSVGLVGIFAGFMYALKTLNKAEEQINLLKRLEEKIWEIEQEAKEKGGIERGKEEGEDWMVQVRAVEAEEEIDLSEDLNRVELRVWNASRENKGEELITLMRNVKEEK